MSTNGNRPSGGAAHAREKAAAFILRECAKLDLRIGTDGYDLILAPPRGMPSARYFSFQRAIIDHRDEIIAIILREGRA